MAGRDDGPQRQNMFKLNSHYCHNAEQRKQFDLLLIYDNTMKNALELNISSCCDHMLAAGYAQWMVMVGLC